jgi:hypothetical protein
MPPPPRQRILPIDQLVGEWQTLGRSDRATQALHLLARRDRALLELVHGGDSGDRPSCPTAFDLIEHMRAAKGSSARAEAAGLIRVMLRESEVDPLVTRFLLQALIPGMVSVASRLRWGQGGAWEDGSEFFAELLATTWVVLTEWSGQDRQYAVLDLLSAIRCRLRRQLFRGKDLQQLSAPLTPDVESTMTGPAETDLEQLARGLIGLHGEGMRSEDVEVLYAHHVLGYSIAELAAVTGRDRRTLYARRDRGQRRILA